MKKKKLDRRSGGVLLHLTSLPGLHGIGDLGKEAHDFAQQLAFAQQRWWQMLPVGPVQEGDSPYASSSSFAGNPLFINLEFLVQDGLLSPKDLSRVPRFPEHRADFQAVRKFKEPLLQKAHEAFVRGRGPKDLLPGFGTFCAKNADWLDDYSLFCALKEIFRGESWLKWGAPFRLRKFEVWTPEFKKRADKIAARHRFVQYLFDRQWSQLRARCKTLGIALLGDVPIFISLDSADVWAHPEIFQLKDSGRPAAVAGVPPDYFSRNGQRWGNPLYDWDILKKSGYAWWISRLSRASERFDALRLDHFIGFCRYWRIPAHAKTARRGRWRPGPGADFFKTVVRKLPKLELIAEDLGAVTPAVFALRDQFRLPRMYVLHFTWEAEKFARRSVAYTGTHDNDTSVGWFQKLKKKEKKKALKRFAAREDEFHWKMIGAVWRSPANTAMVPLQDILGLDSRSRMNFPGVAKGNWGWRLSPGQLSKEALIRLRNLTEETERV